MRQFPGSVRFAQLDEGGELRQLFDRSPASELRVVDLVRDRHPSEDDPLLNRRDVWVLDDLSVGCSKPAAFAYLATHGPEAYSIAVPPSLREKRRASSATARHGSSTLPRPRVCFTREGTSIACLGAVADLISVLKDPPQPLGNLAFDDPADDPGRAFEWRFRRNDEAPTLHYWRETFRAPFWPIYPAVGTIALLSTGSLWVTLFFISLLVAISGMISTRRRFRRWVDRKGDTHA